MHDLAHIAPTFIATAHRIVWATVATVTPAGEPSTRILHPIWEWDGSELIGWIATSPLSPKAKDLDVHPVVSLTYWDPQHDTATAHCRTVWENSDEQRTAGWNRFKNAPAPVGYDPSIIPPWTAPTAPAFGIIRLEPTWLRVLPASAMAGGGGEIMSWRAS